MDGTDPVANGHPKHRDSGSVCGRILVRRRADGQHQPTSSSRLQPVLLPPSRSFRAGHYREHDRSRTTRSKCSAAGAKREASLPGSTRWRSRGHAPTTPPPPPPGRSAGRGRPTFLSSNKPLTCATASQRGRVDCERRRHQGYSRRLLRGGRRWRMTPPSTASSAASSWPASSLYRAPLHVLPASARLEGVQSPASCNAERNGAHRSKAGATSSHRSSDISTRRPPESWGHGPQLLRGPSLPARNAVASAPVDEHRQP